MRERKLILVLVVLMEYYLDFVLEIEKLLTTV